MIRAILACDEDWGIGKAGTLPWPHNPADLKWFKETTSGGVVAMGKATWDSLPNKPLPNRNNIVITSSSDDYIVIGSANRCSGYRYRSIIVITQIGRRSTVWCGHYWGRIG